MKNKMIWVFLLVAGLSLFGCTKDNNKPIDNDVENTNEEETTNDGDITMIPSDQGTSFKGTITKEDFPRIDGSTATIPLSESIYQYVTGATKEEAEANIIHTKTSQSYYNLMDGNADLLIVYEPSPEVLDYQEKGNYKLLKKPIGKDALVFMANKSNPIESLTTEQLVQIYSGKVSNWAEVGGNDSEILAFQRPEGSGSQTLMEKHVMKGEPMAKGVNVSYYNSMEGILEAMAQYNNTGNSLGYSVFYYAKNMYQLPELKFMKINRVEPSLETIYNNTYPYINEFYAVIREDEPEDSTARQIYNWLTAIEGQQLVAEEGYVPVSMEFKENVETKEEFSATPIPEGYYYVATNKLWGDATIPGNVTIYKDNWVNVAEFPNGETYNDYGLQPQNRKIVIGTQVGSEQVTSLKFGLYDLSSLSFSIEPQYDSLWCLNEEFGTYVASNLMDYYLIDENNKVLLTGFSQMEGLGVTIQGNYYWLKKYDPEKEAEIITIYDRQMNQVNQLIHHYNIYGYFDNRYKEDGTPLVSRDIFYDKMNISEEERANLYEFSTITDVNMNHFISVIYNDRAYIFDSEWNLLQSKSRENGEDSYYGSYDSIFSDYHYNYEADENIYLFYDKDLNPINTPTGEPYSRIVLDNYGAYDEMVKEDAIVLYQVVGNKLYNYNVNKEETTEIELGDWTDVSVIKVAGDIIVVKDKEGSYTKVYKKNQLLHTIERDCFVSYTKNDSNYLFLVDYTSSYTAQYYTMIDLAGNIVYQSEYQETIKSIDDYFIQLHRGSYYMIIDYKGNVARKDYRPTLQND